MLRLQIITLFVLFFWTSLLAASEAQLEQARSLFAQKKYRESIEILEELLDTSSSFAQAQHLLGNAQFELGENLAARQAFSRAMEAGILSEDVLVRVAAIELEFERESAALNALRLAHQVFPENLNTQLQLALTLARSGLNEESLRVSTDLARRDPLNRPALILAANTQLMLGDTSAAASLYSNAYSLTVDAALAEKIADLEFRSGKPTVALHWYQRAIDGGESTSALELKRARAQFQSGDVDGAARLAQDLSQLSSASENVQASSFLLLGRIESARGNTQSAQAAWERAFELGDRSPGLLAYLADQNFRSKSFESALGFFELILQSDSENSDALFYATHCEIHLGRTPQAREFLLAYLARNGFDRRAEQLVDALADDA